MTPPADYDPAVVEAALLGVDVAPSPSDRREITLRRFAAGWTAQQIVDRHKFSRSYVYKVRGRFLSTVGSTGRVPNPYPVELFSEKDIRAAAARFIGAVHDDDPIEVWAQLNDMPDYDLKALAIAVAACCDPNQPINQMLAWVDDLGAPA